MDFKAKYKRSDYLNFFRNYLLPEDFEDQSEDVSLGFKPQHISKVTKIGEVPSLELNIYEVTHPSENDPRVSISRDAFRLLAQYGVKRALVVFNSESSSNFRLSLVTIDLKWEEGKRVQKEYSNPRRYSFFLGPETKTHTPEEYLIRQGRVKDFEDLKNRFSIEVVNKDFYTQIAVLFTQLAGGKRTIGRKSIDAGRGLLNLPSTVDDTLDKEFTVRLIGRLVFCWFLKKKKSDKNIPLLPEELLSSEAVSENKGYYHGILEPLFFQVLNTPVDSREKKYQNAPWSQIPFLNGGLFTPHHHDFYEPGPLGISKHINTLKVPDQWIKELFEVFEVYNFTIDENTSVDVELSIEPEMLGRIFENLLAEINPETGETARKATGSYYTPRPIVEYMVDESLKQYLLTKTRLDEAKIKSLLTYEDLAVKLTDSERESVLVALDLVKVIDPACGSGAFPMGILQKMLLILQKVDPESEWWLERKLSQIESKLLKKELGKKLKSENVNYVHKLGIIQGAIYGVDIQPIAVEISKLRFFLSLIVDEKVNDAKENRGIEPLPNLEFKFVCTNSLIGLPKQGKSSDQLFETEDTQSINELKDLRDEYLRSYGIEKEKIQIKFLKIQKRMVEFYWQRILKPQTDLYGNKRELKKQEEPEFTRMLSSWDPFSDESAGWFDPEWMFGIKDGFDVVIANPPYIEFKKVSTEEKKKYHNYVSATGKFDAYVLFIELGGNILKQNGVLVYINPTSFMKKDYGIGIRTFISKIFAVKAIHDFADIQIFESATNYTGIFILVKSVNLKTNILCHKYYNIGRTIEIDELRKAIASESKGPFKDILSCDSQRDLTLTWDFQDPENGRFLKNVMDKSKPLSDYTDEIFEGIASGKDEIFYVSTDQCAELDLEKNSIFRLLKGKDIKAYQINWSGYYVIYPYDEHSKVISEKQLEQCYPRTYRYLLKSKKILSGRDYFDKSGKQWFELWNQRKLTNFKKTRLVTPEISDRNNFAITNEFLGNTKTYHIILKNHLEDFYPYFLGLLNSKLINFIYKKSTTPHTGGFYAYKTQFLKNIPIVIGSDSTVKKISEHVQRLIQASANNDRENPKVATSLREIDNMVYDLYSVSKEGIALVEKTEKGL